MDVPEHIDTYGVHAKSLAHLDAVVPVSLRDTRIVYLRSFYNEWFAVEQERALANGEIATFRCSIGISRHEKSRGCKGEGSE